MLQQADMRNPGDDWTGVTSTVERRKRQNRLNQRAYRRRKHAQAKHPLDGPDETSFPIGLEPDEQTVDITQNSLVPGGIYLPIADRATGLCEKGYLLLPKPDQRARFRALMQRLYQQYTLNAPQPNSLPILIQMNVLNAMAHNAAFLGIPIEGLCRDEPISPFNESGPRLPLPPCPAGLAPTALQKMIVHHPWIDLFPIPAMRDNVLKAMDSELFDEDELCCDLLDIEDGQEGEKPSLIVWGEPWNINSWEASIPFLRKWGWVLRGCPEILEATNFWRLKRGERQLNFNRSAQVEVPD